MRCLSLRTALQLAVVACAFEQLECSEDSGELVRCGEEVCRLEHSRPLSLMQIDAITRMSQRQAGKTVTAERWLSYMHGDAYGLLAAANATMLSKMSDNTSSGPLWAVFIGGVAVGVAGTLVVIHSTRRTLSVACRLPAQSPRLPVTAAAESGDQCEVPAVDPAPLPAMPQPRVFQSATEDVESMHLFWPRASCLMGLLLIQSLSGLIIEDFSGLFQAHPALIVFLTMIVGTGGNVGGQSAVLAVRKLALAEDVAVVREVVVGLKICAVLVPLAFLRCLAQGVALKACATVACSVLAVVLLGATLGAAIPEALCMARIDPAHATPMIQVIMDILGVSTVCALGWLILGATAAQGPEHGGDPSWVAAV